MVLPSDLDFNPIWTSFELPIVTSIQNSFYEDYEKNKASNVYSSFLT